MMRRSTFEPQSRANREDRTLTDMLDDNRLALSPRTAPDAGLLPVNTARARRRNRFWPLVGAFLGYGIWCGSAWIWPGHVNVGDVVGAAVFIFCFLRLVQPSPSGRRRG